MIWKLPERIEKGASKTILMLILILILVGGIYYAYTQSASFRGAFHSVKESTQDATTTSRVRTALLLVQARIAFRYQSGNNPRGSDFDGQVPSDEAKTVAGAIAQDTAGVKQVHNDLGINPTAERNPETERLGERVADLEVKTVIGDALSKRCGTERQTHRRAGEKPNRDFGRSLGDVGSEVHCRANFMAG